MRNIQVDLKSPEETGNLGVWVGRMLQPGWLVTLSGPLGAGKTTFVQGLARGLGVEDAVTSPTFVLMLEYSGVRSLLHMDAYRLEGLESEELMDTGFFDFLQRDDAIKVVEWPEMVDSWLEDVAIRVKLHHEENGGRRAILEFHDQMQFQDDGKCPYPLTPEDDSLPSGNDR